MTGTMKNILGIESRKKRVMKTYLKEEITNKCLSGEDDLLLMSAVLCSSMSRWFLASISVSKFLMRLSSCASVPSMGCSRDWRHGGRARDNERKGVGKEEKRRNRGGMKKEKRRNNEGKGRERVLNITEGCGDEGTENILKGGETTNRRVLLRGKRCLGLWTQLDRKLRQLRTSRLPRVSIVGRE